MPTIPLFDMLWLPNTHGFSTFGSLAINPYVCHGFVYLL